MRYDIMDSDGGVFLLGRDDGGALCLVDYRKGPGPVPVAAHWQRDAAALAPVRRALSAYLNGEPPVLPLPLCPRGTDFQKKVWQQLMTIPYGTTVSYQDIARGLGRPSAVRAVASAIGRNPIQIFIPCHRVIGKNGALRGYAGGLAMKQRLLDLEAFNSP